MAKNNILFGILSVIMVILVGSFVISQGGNTTGKATDPNKEVQVIKLSVENGNYVLNPSTIKKGPVRIEGDIANMPGCSKSVVISAFNVRKTVTEKDNIIEFTANKAGTFNIACSMNMYHGTFTVLEDNGNKPTYVEQQAATGGSCGMASGGGCGCGGMK